MGNFTTRNNANNSLFFGKYRKGADFSWKDYAR